MQDRGKHHGERHREHSRGRPVRTGADGLLRRERRAEAERSVAVRLTEAGARLWDEARSVPSAVGDAMGLTPEQHIMAGRLLRELTANVTANRARTPASDGGHS